MHLKSITPCTGVAWKLRFEENFPFLSNNLWIAVSSGLVGSGAKPQPLTILVHFVDKKEAFGAIKICL